MVWALYCQCYTCPAFLYKVTTLKVSVECSWARPTSHYTCVLGFGNCAKSIHCQWMLFVVLFWAVLSMLHICSSPFCAALCCLWYQVQEFVVCCFSRSSYLRSSSTSFVSWVRTLTARGKSCSPWLPSRVLVAVMPISSSRRPTSTWTSAPESALRKR